VLAAGWGQETEVVFACGWAETGERERKMSCSTVFDVASLTKVVVTLPIALHLLQEGDLELGTTVADVLFGFAGDGPAERRRVTVEQLLTHTSGLPPYRDYWKLGLGPAELAARLVSEPLVALPGREVVYSDIGFYLVGRVCETVTGRRLDELACAWVTSPLGMAETSYGPRLGAEEVAATEPGPDGKAKVGVVHDETAAALGGVSGHAGLFSTAGDLALYLQAWLAPGDRWLARSWREQACVDRTAALGGHRGLGWVARGDAYDQLPENWPVTAVSHTGFTGTSLAFDPPSGRWVVLLTNDVHFGRNRGTIKLLRQAVHRALAP